MGPCLQWAMQYALPGVSIGDAYGTAPMRAFLNNSQYLVAKAATFHAVYLNVSGLHVTGTDSNRDGFLCMGSAATTAKFARIIFPASDAVVGASLSPSATYTWTADGTVYVCGLNDMGQLGIAELGKISTPTVLRGAIFNKTVVDVRASDNHGVALDALGRVYVWGSSRIIKNTEPTLVEEALATKFVVAIATSGLQVFAVTDNGEVYYWGYRSGLSFVTLSPQLLSGVDATRRVTMVTASPVMALIYYGTY
eukprot:Opistho-2@67392